MKKTGILTLAAFLFVGFSFSAGDNIFAQTGQTAASISEQQFLLNSVKNVFGGHVLQSDDVPPITLLNEPVFTSGLNNIIYWEPLPDTLILNPDGYDLKIPRDSSFVLISAAFDSMDQVTSRIVTGAVDSLVFDESYWNSIGVSDYLNRAIYYWALLVVKDPDNSDSLFVSSSRIVISSQQDMTAPTVDTLRVTDEAGNQPESGWFNGQTIWIQYENLTDPAGLRTATLDIAGERFVNTFKEVPDGQPGSFSETGKFILTNLPSGVKQTTLSACDAAYHPDNHGAGDGITAVWDFDSNCADQLASVEIKVDRDPPKFDFSGVKNIYTAADLEDDGTITFSFKILDLLSGIDIDSIKVEIANPDTLYIVEQMIDAEEGALEVVVPVVIDGIPPFGIEEQITLNVSAADRAGNSASDQHLIIVSIDPVDFTFELFDLSTGADSADSGYTNDSIIGWRFHSVGFDTNEIAKIEFTPDNDSGLNTVWEPGQAKELGLEQIYPQLVSNVEYVVFAAVTLNDGLTSKTSSLPSYSIYYDNIAPSINDFSITDIDSLPLKANPGFTNSDTVDVIFKASDAESVKYMRFEGDVECLLIENLAICENRIISYDSALSVILDKTGEPEKNISFSARDKAGNWSPFENSSDTTVLLQQEITVDIDADSPFVVVEKNIKVKLPVNVSCTFSKYFDYGKTLADSFFVGDLSDSCKQVGDSVSCTIYVDFLVTDLAFDTIKITDLAGNISNTDTIYFDIQTPPEISLTLFDSSEFRPDSPPPFDSLYTDALEDNGKIIARVNRLDGSWASLRIAFEGEDIESKEWQPVEAGQFEYNFSIEVDSLSADCQIGMIAQAQNIIGEASDIVHAAIIHDTVEPILETFKLVADNGYENIGLDIVAHDDVNCESGLAGIVVRDSVAATGEEKWFYLPWSAAELLVEPIDANGMHYFSAFVVDNADVDQDVQAFSGSSFDALQALGKIDHPSATRHVFINIQENSGLSYNYPNPFNPEKESTSFHFALASEGDVDIQIFDLFGNLVWERSGIYCEKMNDAFNGPEQNNLLLWDGRNGHGDFVASGTYIAVIKPENKSSLKPIKIGVLREN